MNSSYTLRHGKAMHFIMYSMNGNGIVPVELVLAVVLSIPVRRDQSDAHDDVCGLDVLCQHSKQLCIIAKW